MILSEQRLFAPYGSKTRFFHVRGAIVSLVSPIPEREKIGVKRAERGGRPVRETEEESIG
jgi:hypothetical protein